MFSVQQTWQQQHRMPALVWISAFFSPHAFLAGILLNYSRQNGVPYDALTFEHVVCCTLRHEIKLKNFFSHNLVHVLFFSFRRPNNR